MIGPPLPKGRGSSSDDLGLTLRKIPLGFLASTRWLKHLVPAQAHYAITRSDSKLFADGANASAVRGPNGECQQRTTARRQSGRGNPGDPEGKAFGAGPASTVLYFTLRQKQRRRAGGSDTSAVSAVGGEKCLGSGCPLGQLPVVSAR